MDSAEGARIPGRALKIGIAGAIAFGALATGLIVSRRGRHLMKEAWQGRRRTRIEDRVLDALWGDRLLGRRPIDVAENENGTITLFGSVRSARERNRAIALAERVKDVNAVVDRIEVDPSLRRSRFEKE